MSDRAGDTTAGGTTAIDELVSARQARIERDGLLDRRRVYAQMVANAAGQLDQARQRHQREQGDVVRLESVSVTRILAGLRGRRDAELDRERAEAEAAAYELAVVEARLDAIRADIASTDLRLAGMADVDGRWERALVRRADELTASGDPAGTRLDELGATVGERSAELAQIGEAAIAAQAALRRLGEAQDILGSAGSWSTYDTFFGGGFVAGMVKYNRLDRAAAAMRAADEALTHLAGELGDVGIGSIGEIGISEMTAAFDVWFDSIFSDWAVHGRIRDAKARVDQITAGVVDVRRELERRRDVAEDSIAAAHAERERLVGDSQPGS